MTDRRPLSLDDRYLREEGTVYLSGMQALVRLPLDQARRDRRAGRRIGTFISGYPGSPLGGYDLALAQAGPLLERHDIIHLPAANEELAATAISGTQMLDHYPHSRVDGVVALWYGKGPGVDRSGDALKHGNFAGTSEHGAVVILSGEDHDAKSSTMPFQDDYAFVGHGIPILYPATTAEFLTLGLHAIALSRFSGCWVALKLVGQLADGGSTIALDPTMPAISTPELVIDGAPFRKRTDFTFFPGLNIETERRLYYERHRAVVAYARANRLDRVDRSGPRDRLGLVTAGKSQGDVLQALQDLGLEEAARAALGIRVLRIGLSYPIDGETVREFARGLEEIVVVEEKRGFLETQVKEALSGAASTRVVGKFDERGRPLFPIQGALDADLIAERLGPRLIDLADGHPILVAGIERRLREIASIRARPALDASLARTPNYCSGCPHNVSTRLLPGEVAWGSPGCHSFASIIEQPERHIVSMTQLGGEGLPWIGLAPYTDRDHLVQNVGDGSLFHSSYLNIRFAVAAGANLTFKILYNGAVANTGAQHPVGGKSVPDLTRLLEIEGVTRTVVLARDPARYRSSVLAGNAQVVPVERQEEALDSLRRTPGVTVLIYDGFCANERRRLQKRGKAETPTRFVMINEEVCEGCGDCGALTNCMSLHPVETEFGRKTRIHASSCNQDYSCLGGDCPSFVTVETTRGTGYRKPTPPVLAADAVAEPVKRVDLEQPYHLYLPGVGGTGVLTLNAVLAWAALLDGKSALSYDQTGAAQKWGPVLSSLTIARDDRSLASNRVGMGRADLYLALDLLASSTRINLDRCDPDHTRAVVNTSVLPSGEMVRNPTIVPPVAAMRRAIASVTRAGGGVELDARRLAEGLFGDYLATNVLALGAAYQAGLLPLGAEAIEAAIRLNGVLVDQNVQAFRYGRLWQADPARVESLLASLTSAGAPVARSLRRSAGLAALLDRAQHLDEESRRLLSSRLPELIEYQDERYARRYLDVVIETAANEEAAVPGSREITHAAIRFLYKLMAYKDEYEVARLLTKTTFQASIASTFEAPRRVRYHLHPPVLRTLGLRRKLALGRWIAPVLVALRSLRRLRGTGFDPFGRAGVRRQERALIGWYQDLLREGLARLDGVTAPTVLELASLPDAIRGYERLKLESIEHARARGAQLLNRLSNLRT